MDAYEAKETIKKLTTAIIGLQNKAQREGRGMTGEEISLVAQLEGAIVEAEKSLPQSAQTVMQNGVIGSMNGRLPTSNTGPYALVEPNGRKDHKSLFGNNYGISWEDKDTNFFSAVFSGRHHPNLIKNSMAESVPSDGGFLIPEETAAKIHSVALENEIVSKYCYIQPMRSNSIKIPAMSIGDHSSALFGGFTASYTAEQGTISEASPKSRAMELNAKKLTGLIRFSAELDADVPGGMNQIEQLCGRGLGYYRDKAFFSGTGAGTPLGILNAPCLVEVEKETGQDADTILYENLTKIMSRMFAGSFQNSVWVFHQSCIPQLLQLSIGIGTGGAFIPAMTEGKDGVFRILTRPCIFTEKVEPLGDKGDVLLADFSQYVIGLRSEMRFQTSIHAHFETDELLSRIIERHDGQPLWDSALTLADGTTTVSPFVTLAARE